MGAFSGSASAYGTYDESGDVFQWNDAVISGPKRGYRGGAWNNGTASLWSSNRDGFDPTLEVVSVGFRLASGEAVPEPTGILTGLLCIWSAALRRRRGRVV